MQRHRELIRPDLNDQYQQICSEQTEFTTWLFGDDLPKQVQDISAINRVSQQLSSRQTEQQSGATHFSRNAHRPWGQYNPNFRQASKCQKGKRRSQKQYQKEL